MQDRLQRFSVQFAVQLPMQSRLHVALSLQTKVQPPAQSKSHEASSSHDAVQLPVHERLHLLRPLHVSEQFPFGQVKSHVSFPLHMHDVPQSRFPLPESPLLAPVSDASVPGGVVCPGPLPIVQSYEHAATTTSAIAAPRILTRQG
jgi:hypothetical protein